MKKLISFSLMLLFATPVVWGQTPTPTMTPCGGRSWVKMTDMTGGTFNSATSSYQSGFHVGFWVFDQDYTWERGNIYGHDGSFVDGTDQPADQLIYLSVWIVDIGTYPMWDVTANYDDTTFEYFL